MMLSILLIAGMLQIELGLVLAVDGFSDCDDFVNVANIDGIDVLHNKQTHNKWKFQIKSTFFRIFPVHICQ